MKKLTRDDLRKLIVAEAKRLHEMSDTSGAGERIDLPNQAITSLHDALDIIRMMKVYAGNEPFARTAAQMILDLERMISKLRGY